MGEERSGGEIGRAGNDILFGQMPKTIGEGEREAGGGSSSSRERDGGWGKGEEKGSDVVERVASREWGWGKWLKEEKEEERM